MNKKFWIIISVIALLLLLGLSTHLKETPEPEPKKEHVPHPITPYKSSISATGVIEASSDNINIGTTLNRVVSSVKVKVGSKVKKGEILFELENHDLMAELEIQNNGYQKALAEVQKLQEMPRREDLEAADANLKSAELELKQAQRVFDMVKNLKDSRALSQEAINQREFNVQQAEANLKKAQAEFERIRGGVWNPDLKIAQLSAKQAKANVEKVKAEIDRTKITSPIEGTVLKINVHEGELSATNPSIPSMIIGNTDELYVRTSINQFYVPFFRPDAPAVGYVQGDARIKYPLEFVRVEPILTNKQEMTNALNDKVDTRVLQVIYRLKPDHQPIYVGQRMDVFIEMENLQ